MYKCGEDNWCTVYETLDELLQEEIILAAEDKDYYYIRLKPKQFYDNSMWKVDKQTGKVSYMMYPQYIVRVEDNAVEINPETLRKRVS